MRTPRSTPRSLIRLPWIAILAMTLPLGIGPAGPQAAAQEKYPTKTITYLVTFDPGGQSDREARRQQPHLERLLGQKVLIDYKVGGGGALGWRELVKSKPDGYTIGGFNIPHIILQPMQQEVGYKTEQIVPVALFQRTILALAVLNTSQFKTLQDFIDYAKKNPGALTVGGSATFSGPHMATLRFEKLTGTKVTYVPFTGAAPQTMAFLGGHTAAAISNSDDLVRYKDKVRVLAFASEMRFPDFPDAPTFKEQGIDLQEAVDRGVGVPAGTPDAIIQRLEAAFLEICRNPEIQVEMKKQGFVPLAMGHQETKAYVEKMTGIYRELMAGIKK
ncbi:MAG TPA: tripartite tricarboxylate transporter substrate binding protein [Candidatus Methylomirabilis sp.]|nr:tripartite tricarboxylate transporter substrate binding protein [Candidatus Methylomirabilis sp.]